MDITNAKRSQSATQRDNADIRQLLEKVAGKDEQAFAALYDATINLLYGVALRITQSDDMAEEVINETYLQIWQQAQKYSAEQSSVKTWLVMLCRSRAIDALRRNKHHAQTLEFQEDKAETQTSTLPDLMAAVERDSKLHAELDKLSNTQRQLLSLAFFRGYTHSELADFLNMPLGTVKTQIRRAMIQLKEKMADFEGN